MSAKVKFTKTTKNNLTNVEIIAGQLIYITDTGEQYMDISDVERIQITDTRLINKTEDNDVSGILNFTNGLKINNNIITYNQSTNTVTFE